MKKSLCYKTKIITKGLNRNETLLYRCNTCLGRECILQFEAKFTGVIPPVCGHRCPFNSVFSCNFIRIDDEVK